MFVYQALALIMPKGLANRHSCQRNNQHQGSPADMKMRSHINS